VYVNDSTDRLLTAKPRKLPGRVRNCAAGIFVGLGLLISILGAHAASQPKTQTAKPAARSGLSLKTAINDALASNPHTQSSRAGQRVASGQRVQARSTLLPHLSAKVSQSRERDNLKARGLNFGSVYSPQAGGKSPVFPSTTTYNRFQAGLSVKQKIFDYSAWQRYHAAQQAQHAASARVGAASTQVAAKTERQYIAVLAAREKITAARADLKLARQLLSLAHGRHNVGVATNVDVARARTRLSQAKTRLARARTARTRAVIQLERTIGIKIGKPLKLASHLEFLHVPLVATTQGAVQRALANRNDIQVARDRVKQGEKQLSAARARRLPTVSFSGSWGTAGNTPARGEDTTYQIGAEISVPIFTGGQISGRIDSASGQLSQRRIQLRDKRRGVAQNVRIARRTLKSLATEVRSARTNLKQAKAELKQARDQYRNGTRDNIAVVNAQSSLASARQQRVRALADYTRARIQRAAALGLARHFRIDRALANGSHH